MISKVDKNKFSYRLQKALDKEGFPPKNKDTKIIFLNSENNVLKKIFDNKSTEILLGNKQEILSSKVDLFILPFRLFFIRLFPTNCVTQYDSMKGTSWKNHKAML